MFYVRFRDEFLSNQAGRERTDIRTFYNNEHHMNLQMALFGITASLRGVRMRTR